MSVRHLPLCATLIAMVRAAPLHSQLPSPVALQDTVFITSFSLNNGSDSVLGGPLVLNHTLGGFVTPTHYRVSTTPPTAATPWVAYPSSVPTWSTFLQSPNPQCSSNNAFKVKGYFQVRGRKPTTRTYVTSQIVSDTTCWSIGG